MTTIIYKDGTLYGDTFATNEREDFRVNKLFRRTTQYGTLLVGASGGLSACIIFKNWVFAGEDENNIPVIFSDEDDKGVYNFTGLVVSNTRAIKFYDRTFIPATVLLDEGEYLVLGSGVPWAEGAMDAGATPEEAIKITAKHTRLTNDIITSVSFKDETDNNIRRK